MRLGFEVTRAHARRQESHTAIGETGRFVDESSAVLVSRCDRRGTGRLAEKRKNRE
jgi:hypothetical protein